VTVFEATHKRCVVRVFERTHHLLEDIPGDFRGLRFCAAWSLFPERPIDLTEHELGLINYL